MINLNSRRIGGFVERNHWLKNFSNYTQFPFSSNSSYNRWEATRIVAGNGTLHGEDRCLIVKLIGQSTS